MIITMISNVMIIAPPPTAPLITYITEFGEDSNGTVLVVLGTRRLVVPCSTIRYITAFDEDGDSTFFVILGARRLIVARPVNDNEVKT